MPHALPGPRRLGAGLSSLANGIGALTEAASSESVYGEKRTDWRLCWTSLRTRIGCSVYVLGMVALALYMFYICFPGDHIGLV